MLSDFCRGNKQEGRGASGTPPGRAEAPGAPQTDVPAAVDAPRVNHESPSTCQGALGRTGPAKQPPCRGRSPSAACRSPRRLSQGSRPGCSRRSARTQRTGPAAPLRPDGTSTPRSRPAVRYEHIVISHQSSSASSMSSSSASSSSPLSSSSSSSPWSS